MVCETCGDTGDAFTNCQSHPCNVRAFVLVIFLLLLLILFFTLHCHSSHYIAIRATCVNNR